MKVDMHAWIMQKKEGKTQVVHNMKRSTLIGAIFKPFDFLRCYAHNWTFENISLSKATVKKEDMVCPDKFIQKRVRFFI